MVMMIQTTWTGDRADLLWLVGIFDGEGCLYKQRNRGRSGGYGWTLQVQMSDEDTILRVRGVVGAGNVTSQPPRAANRKRMYRWTLYSQHEVGAVLRAMLPHLSARRRALAEEALISLP